jgi:hypothetical protein
MMAGPLGALPGHSRCAVRKPEKNDDSTMLKKSPGLVAIAFARLSNLGLRAQQNSGYAFGTGLSFLKRQEDQSVKLRFGPAP